MSVDKRKRKRGVHMTTEQASASGRKGVPVALDHVEEPAGADFKRNKPEKEEHLSDLTHTQTQKQPNS